MPRDQDRTPRLGAHVSTAGGVERAIDRAREIDAESLQIFLTSPRRWEPAPLGAAATRAFRRGIAAAGLAPFALAHSSYLINLAAPSSGLRERSIAALGLELERCSRLGIPALVLHPGAHAGAGVEAGLERVADALDRVLVPRRRCGGAVRVLLELTAGQGTSLGHRFEQLRAVLERSRASDRLGVCFDTCHVFAAGYDFRDRAGYARTMAELDRQVGLDRVGAFHLNDSHHRLGSRRDRHEHIGEGQLGREPFARILQDRRFRGLPMVLETPKGPTPADDRRNLAVLRGMLERRTR